jgi:tRNA pseudouridine32 synthase / 23S rRNA pseudouridine746 synthase
VNAPLPIDAGVGPSSQWLPAGNWKTVLEFLVDHYPGIPEQTWISRMSKGEVVDETGQQLFPESVYREGACIFYYRELEQETPIPFSEAIVYQDEHLLVVDKPHFLPVVPAGRFLRETLLVRLRLQGQPDSLVPIHRLDRETAGLVLFSRSPKTRGNYTALFRERKVKKVYEALASLPGRSETVDFPITRRSRIISGEPFFRMLEVSGLPNAETVIELLERSEGLARFELRPRSGKKHQLRVHMAALGLPILNDRLYPEAVFVPHADREDDFAKPLKLLARALGFTDPVTGQERFFESERRLTPPVGCGVSIADCRLPISSCSKGAKSKIGIAACRFSCGKACLTENALDVARG